MENVPLGLDQGAIMGMMMISAFMEPFVNQRLNVSRTSKLAIVNRRMKEILKRTFVSVNSKIYIDLAFLAVLF
jgi:hypothetical protein